MHEAVVEEGNRKVRGLWLPGEDRVLLKQAAMHAFPWLQQGQITPLLKDDVLAGTTNVTTVSTHILRRQEQIKAKVTALEQGKLKRFAFRLETRAGPRIVDPVLRGEN